MNKDDEDSVSKIVFFFLSFSLLFELNAIEKSNCVTGQIIQSTHLIALSTNPPKVGRPISEYFPKNPPKGKKLEKVMMYIPGHGIFIVEGRARRGIGYVGKKVDPYTGKVSSKASLNTIFVEDDHYIVKPKTDDFWKQLDFELSEMEESLSLDKLYFNLIDGIIKKRASLIHFKKNFNQALVENNIEYTVEVFLDLVEVGIETSDREINSDLLRRVLTSYQKLTGEDLLQSGIIDQFEIESSIFKPLTDLQKTAIIEYFFYMERRSSTSLDKYSIKSSKVRSGVSIKLDQLRNKPSIENAAGLVTYYLEKLKAIKDEYSLDYVMSANRSIDSSLKQTNKDHSQFLAEATALGLSMKYSDESIFVADRSLGGAQKGQNGLVARIKNRILQTRTQLEVSDDSVQGKNIMLIDDIEATGATSAISCKRLIELGANKCVRVNIAKVFPKSVFKKLRYKNYLYQL